MVRDRGDQAVRAVGIATGVQDMCLVPLARLEVQHIAPQGFVTIRAFA